MTGVAGGRCRKGFLRKICEYITTCHMSTKEGEKYYLQKKKPHADGQHMNLRSVPMEEAVGTCSGSSSMGFFDLYSVPLGMTLELFGYNRDENWNEDSGSIHSANKNAFTWL